MVGQTVSHFKIIAELGRGGMGVVYKAEDINLHCFRALKFLSSETLANEADRARFLAEARTLAAIEHANICPVHEIGEADGRTFIAMSFLEGETLEQKIARGPLEVADAVAIAKQMATGLQKAHGAGVIHRDIKPANVMITAEDVAVIMDFGLAKQEGATRLTQTGSTLGTAAYMSPEQVSGAETDLRTDLWSLGVMMYEMLAGQRPFQADNQLSLMYAISREHPEPISRLRSGVPAALEEIVERLLEKDPQSRFADAGALLSALEALEETVASTAIKRFRLQRWQRRRLGRILAVGVPVVALVIVALFVWPGILKPERAISSLAVMPLVERAAAEDQAYFAEGITDELITGLMKIGRDLTVVSRTSAARAREQYETLREVARRLGVDAVVEGTVQREGERIRVSVQLVLARTSELLWADSYERDLRDVFVLQSELARAVARAIEAELTPAGRQEPAATRQIDPVAYELVLKGRYQAAKYSPEGLQRSIESFEAAIAIDPDYAEPYVGLASTYITFSLGHGGGMDWQTAIPLATAYVDSALRLDPDLAIARVAAASLALWKWDWERAEREFERAITLDPGSSAAWDGLGFLLALLNEGERAVAASLRARQLDPLQPILSANLGVSYIAAGRFEEAEAAFKAGLELEPGFYPSRVTMAEFYLEQGRYDEAIALLKDIVEEGDTQSGELAQLGTAYALAGRRAEAEEILQRLEEQPEVMALARLTMAILYNTLGQPEKAVELILEDYALRDPWFPWYIKDSKLASLRSDPRIAAIFSELKLPTD
jgi:TolB-like protein/Tfp pilus assembly protein PilF/tRNA A-37 threonylcarbamoyl transferase component Bud32